MDAQSIIKQAEEEYKMEKSRRLIEEHKERLRRRENFWIRIFPWKVSVERRDRPTKTELAHCDVIYQVQLYRDENKKYLEAIFIANNEIKRLSHMVKHHIPNGGANDNGRY